MDYAHRWLQDREADVIDLPLEYCQWSWESVTGVVGALVTERAWPERPSHLCRSCPYKDNPCTAYARFAGLVNDYQPEGLSGEFLVTIYTGGEFVIVADGNRPYVVTVER